MRQRSLPVKEVVVQKHREIPPNAGKTIAALRELGYGSHTALCDIIDNSLDAGATKVWVSVKQMGKQLALEILDNGRGMDEQTLTEAMRIGSDTPHETYDLGKFGIGLKTAGMSLARCIIVLSRQDKGQAWEANLDLDLIAAENKWLLPMHEANSKIVLDTVGDHGTLVRLNKIDRIDDKNVARFTNNFRCHVGQVYRHYIKSKKATLYVNRQLVPQRDPLMLDNPLTKVVLDCDLNISDDRTPQMIHLKAVELPELTQAEEKSAGILPHASGFYIVRNGREIVEATTFNLYRHHHSYSHFRCEISFTGTPEIDRLLHVDIRKSTVHPERTLLERLSAKVKGVIEDSGRKDRLPVLPEADPVEEGAGEDAPTEPKAATEKNFCPTCGQPLKQGEDHAA